jgi:hypothetical protein
MDKEVSDLKLTRVECVKCGAQWINSNHVWKTGDTGSEADLAGLVCNKLGDDNCINPLRGVETGDTWEQRLGDMETGFNSKRERLEDQRARFKEQYGEDPHFDD